MREQPKAYIYWLHLPEHLDMKSEGYIGVADDHRRRFRRHRSDAISGEHYNPHLQRAFQKYGDQIQKHIVWIGEEVDCYKNEEILRPKKDIGWNIDKGGNKPPSWSGKKHSPQTILKIKKPRHSDEEKQKRRERMIGNTYGLGVKPTTKTKEKLRHATAMRKRDPATGRFI